MKVTYLTDKGIGPQNEDVYLMKDNLFGIFDGATGWIKYFDKDGKSAGTLAAETAKEVFSSNSSEPLKVLVQKTGEEIWERMIANNIAITDKAQLWQTSAAVVRLNEDSLEYIQIGDSPILFVHKDGSIKAITIDHDIETLNMWVKVANEGVKEILKDERIFSQLLKNRREANITYGVINGEEKALKFLNEGMLSTEDIDFILIFSDGFLIPKQDPESTENYGKIIELFKDGGLEKIKDYVREIEDSDPNCIKYPRFKQHDDMTAIAIDFR